MAARSLHGWIKSLRWNKWVSICPNGESRSGSDMALQKKQPYAAFLCSLIPARQTSNKPCKFNKAVIVKEPAV